MNSKAKKEGSQPQSSGTQDPVRDAIHASLNPLEAIRDLLHGDQVRQIEGSLDKLSQDISTQLQSMNDKFRESLCQLSTDIGEKMQELGLRIDAVNQHQNERSDQLQQRLESLHQETLEANLELQQSLQAEANHLTEEIDQRYAEVMSDLDTAKHDLSDKKADRKTLACLLTQMANQLEASEPDK